MIELSIPIKSNSFNNLQLEIGWGCFFYFYGRAEAVGKNLGIALVSGTGHRACRVQPAPGSLKLKSGKR